MPAGKRASSSMDDRLRFSQHFRPYLPDMNHDLIPIICLVLLLEGCSLGLENSPPSSSISGDNPSGMILIPGGEFNMGSSHKEAKPDEKPVHRVRVDAFYIDETEVTNAQFREFVEATHYVTTAERPPSLSDIMSQLPPGTPSPNADVLQPGALVFMPPTVDGDYWWQWVTGANWRHPEGPDSSIEGKDHYPVVQVSWFDAVAYATWSGKRLPTEAEWEFAARGGLENKIYAWGDQAPLPHESRANIWDGQFPVKDLGQDGFKGTSPVKSFLANGYGLYDMTGNVWEWVNDWYRVDAHTHDAVNGIVINPQGPLDSFDPEEPYIAKRTQRGGSFLCAVNYCASYRPSARMKASPDTGLVHTGFRCVRSLQ